MLFSLLKLSVRKRDHLGFVIKLVLDDHSIQFEPGFEDFEVTLVNVYNLMLKSISLIPRVEPQLLHSERVNIFFILCDIMPILCVCFICEEKKESLYEG